MSYRPLASWPPGDFLAIASTGQGTNYGAYQLSHMNVGRLMNTNEDLLADFLTPDEVAAELKICARTLDRWRRLGDGPPITRLGRRIIYRRSSLQEWLRSREHGDKSRPRERRAAA